MHGRPVDITSEIDRLYRLSPEDFTAARNALARRLKEAGAAEAEGHVKALRRPTLAAWALNCTSRRSPDVVGQVAEAGREAREAHERLVAGECTVEEIVAARDRLDAAISCALAIVKEVLADAGREGDALSRARDTLRAAAFDEALAATLADACLARDASPEERDVGLFGFAVQAEELRPPERVAPPSRQATPAAEAAEQVRRLEEERDFASAAAVEALRALKAAEDEAAQGRHEVEECEERLRAATEALASARERLVRADEAALAARVGADAAQSRLDAADAAVDGARRRLDRSSGSDQDRT